MSEQIVRLPKIAMRFSREVQVVYPVDRGRIALRCGAETWERCVLPDSVDDDGHRHRFTVSSERPYEYCRPCLLDVSAERQAVGPRVLVPLTDPRRRDIYPYFDPDSRGFLSEILALPLDGLSDDLSVRVYLPPGYTENTLKRYPVLYMHDGANLFLPEEAFLGRDWRVDDTLELLESISAIDKTIVVGIYANRRETDYTAPGYERYGRTLVRALLPEVNSRFRTLPGPETTGVLGSSLGGVLAFYLGWQFPGTFGMAACLSSTFDYRDDLIQRVLAEPPGKQRFYLDSGWPGDNYEVSLSMGMALRSRGYVYGRDVLHLVFPEATHDEEAWAARLHLPIQFFSGKVLRAGQVGASGGSAKDDD